MSNSVRTIYTTQDPDYGTLVLGFFQETPFYCAKLFNEVSSPIVTPHILLYDPPADMNGSDYIEGVIESTPGNITEDDIDVTFTFIQSKSISIAGIIQALINITLDLDQVDATYGGAARLETVLAELLKYNISTETTTQIGILTHTISKDIAGNITTPAYAEQTLTDIFFFDVGVTSPLEFGVIPGHLLQMRVKITFSAYTPSLASTNTIAKCRLNCFRDLSKNTILRATVI